MNLFLCSSQHLERFNNPSFCCFYFLILKLSRGHATRTLCLYSRCRLATAPYLCNSTWYVKEMLQNTLVLPFATTETRHKVPLQAVPQGYHNTPLSHLTYASLSGALIFNSDLDSKSGTPGIIYSC